MIPDADLVIACPYCSAAARVFQLFSGNTLGAITWTDGWMDAPMQPKPPRITRCHSCQKIYWVFLAPQLGFLPFDETGVAAGEFKDAPHATPIGEADCFEALREGLGAGDELELELRVLTWWRGNDAFREPQNAAGYSSSPEAIANMERFIAMTENGDEDLLLFRAEALRHLGRFDDARQTLNGVGCSDYWPAKSRQLELMEAGTRNLAILFSADRPPEHYNLSGEPQATSDH
jgi:hypothetical protein